MRVTQKDSQKKSITLGVFEEKSEKCDDFRPKGPKIRLKWSGKAENSQKMRQNPIAFVKLRLVVFRLSCRIHMDGTLVNSHPSLT